VSFISTDFVLQQNQIFGANQWNSLARGSQTIGYILASMESFVGGKALPGVEQDPSQNIVLLQAHDFNLMYAQEILDLNYVFDQAKSARSDMFTTTGQLRFDLYYNPETESYFVQAIFNVPSPTQQRQNAPLSVETPPQVVVLSMLACDGQVYCPYETFKSIVLETLTMDCVEEPLRSTLLTMGNNSSDTSSGDSDNESSDSSSSSSSSSSNSFSSMGDESVLLHNSSTSSATFGVWSMFLALVVPAIHYWI